MISKPVDLICTWYVHDNPEDASVFPQTGKLSGTKDALNIYLSCTIVFFQSAETETDAHRVFFTNMRAIPEPYSSQLSDLGVEVVRLQNATRAPSYGSGSTWGNQLYIFDVLEYLSKTRTFDRVLILDSDCVLRSDLGDLFADVTRYGALTYNLMGKKSHVMNGISRSDLTELYAGLYNTSPGGTLFYCGGEFFAATKAMVERLHSEFSDIKDRLLSEFSRRRGGEEAHALTMLYYGLRIPIGTANPYIKRCWTTFKYNNLTREDADNSLCILHFPAEKLTGFRSAYRGLASWKKLRGDERRAFLHQEFGMPRRTPIKTVRDGSRLLLEKARR